MGFFQRFHKAKPDHSAFGSSRYGSSDMAGSQPGSRDAKAEIFRKFEEVESKKAPSELFVSGAVFDISRRGRDSFLQAVRELDAVKLHNIFINAYLLYINHPEVAGFNSTIVNKNNEDTDPRTWNADVFRLETGDYAALLFMPINNPSFSARIIGIIFNVSDPGNGIHDGYYYCMLNKDETTLSPVYRNKAMTMQGIQKTGEVKGIGFELMNDFLNCITSDYLA